MKSPRDEFMSKCGNLSEDELKEVRKLWDEPEEESENIRLKKLLLQAQQLLKAALFLTSEDQLEADDLIGLIDRIRKELKK